MWAIAIVIALSMGGSYIYNGCTTPVKSNSEYISIYRVLHATHLTDKEILEEKAEDEIRKLSWKVSNGILDARMKERNIEHKDWKAQKSLDQILWHNMYYDYNQSIDDFIDSQYSKEK